ncbi:type II toxin-antitoxin system ParD family antitoxin [Agrobacterium tumefaciens]|uniref:ribbon-helix-helix domain-containing protein n=1 Tax=Agrobacterium tumefaciens TaxID=358 RepID=UPI00287E7BD5|nr:type II toxin-antitoxin system ParD family antitoxin [Agrobacterium tumefaciens]MDS7596524.1 type II toxin-antitoxin system ParD family antitoxin [Agrobacterium tumefaciens]
MSVKASVSISDQQESFARKLVEEGRYASLSAVVQRGLELVREETEMKEAELAALRLLLIERSEGDFVSIDEGRSRIDAMLTRKKASHGL